MISGFIARSDWLSNIYNMYTQARNSNSVQSHTLIMLGVFYEDTEADEGGRARKRARKGEEVEMTNVASGEGDPASPAGAAYSPAIPTVDSSVQVTMTASGVAEDAVIVSQVPTRQDFVKDFNSRLWVTYRKGFAPIAPTELTTDTGWGCMLRSGQMLLGQALIMHYLGRDWRMDPSNPSEAYLRIVRWLHDHPDPDVPYSIHNIAQVGHFFGKRIGEWFGPTTISEVIKNLVRRHAPDGMTCYVARDATLFLDQIEALCQTEQNPVSPAPSPTSDEGKGKEDADEGAGSWWGFGSAIMPAAPPGEDTVDMPVVNRDTAPREEREWRPLLLLVPLRLGLECVNEIYIPALKTILALPQSVGIAGGKPRASLYFVGYQGDSLFYLDPHRVENTVDFDELPTDTYHCSVPKRMSIENLDPSLTVGFYCRDYVDYKDLLSSFEKIEESLGTPLFTIYQTAPESYTGDLDALVNDNELSSEDDFEFV